jgi:hypothetical protein
MPGVPRDLIEHSLNVDPKATLKRQHLRRFTEDRRDAIKKELAKLLAVGFIREVFHPEWLANPVLVRKKITNEWRMCVDYTDLNKHCPKDPFGLPRIDQVIDFTAGRDLLCFLDCYSGYHQIAIKEGDQEKTAFITPFGAYCYTSMSFGLKNIGATYQRAIQACFKRQLNKNVKAYVDDVVIKTRNSDTLIADLEEIFASLREYRWKLNPNKCVFDVPSGKLLGFIIIHRGIEANPEKISAITKMKAPTCIKDVQKLTGCMAALNRFISKLGVGDYLSSNYSSIKRSSCGLQRRIKLWLNSRTSCPNHQSSRLLAKRSSYCSTTLRLLTWSVLPSLSSGKKTATPTQSSDHSTSPARSCRNLKHATNQCRSYCMQCSSPRESYDTTSRSTRSPSSLTTRSVTSCETKKLLEESLSGQLNSTPLTSTSRHEQPSSRKH